jgi:hypothetical protein
MLGDFVYPLMCALFCVFLWALGCCVLSILWLEPSNSDDIASELEDIQV